MISILRIRLFSALRVCVLLGLFLWDGTLSSDNEKWLPYDTGKHAEIGRNFGFSGRLYQYLKFEKKLNGKALISTFDYWNKINLGHIFEETALEAYGVTKNEKMFGYRIPDGVEDGILDQVAQYTVYSNSTFIEVKFMRELSFNDNRIKGQIMDMIDFLSYQVNHKTTPRTSAATFFPLPGKASEEELAILVFITPSNCKVGQEIIDYAVFRHVKIYQQVMLYNYFNSIQVKLSQPEALTKPSRHLFGHIFLPQKTKVSWDKIIIDPDNGKPIKSY